MPRPRGDRRFLCEAYRLADHGCGRRVEYRHGESAGGIQGHITALGHKPQHYTTFYVDVEDLQAALDHAVAPGGKKIVGPIAFPEGVFAWFSDPEGNMIGLVKPARA